MNKREMLRNLIKATNSMFFTINLTEVIYDKRSF